jgi:hypothetical protein
MVVQCKLYLQYLQHCGQVGTGKRTLPTASASAIRFVAPGICARSYFSTVILHKGAVIFRPDLWMDRLTLISVKPFICTGPRPLSKRHIADHPSSATCSRAITQGHQNDSMALSYDAKFTVLVWDAPSGQECLRQCGILKMRFYQ